MVLKEALKPLTDFRSSLIIPYAYVDATLILPSTFIREHIEVFTLLTNTFKNRTLCAFENKDVKKRFSFASVQQPVEPASRLQFSIGMSRLIFLL